MGLMLRGGDNGDGSFWHRFCRFFLLAWFLIETLRLVRFLGSVSRSQLFLLYICG